MRVCARLLYSMTHSLDDLHPIHDERLDETVVLVVDLFLWIPQFS